MANHSSLGLHTLADFKGCPSGRLNDVNFLQSIMREAALRAGATIVQEVFHQFNPHGLSGVVVIKESHLAVHTWPEYGCASIDLFTCGSTLRPQAAIDFLKTALEAKYVEVQIIKRGAVETRPPFSPDLEV